MTSYIFSLDEGRGEGPHTEAVEAIDDIDAQSLAEVRLLLTKRFTQIIATRNGHQICHLRRDSLSANAVPVPPDRSVRRPSQMPPPS